MSGCRCCDSCTRDLLTEETGRRCATFLESIDRNLRLILSALADEVDNKGVRSSFDASVKSGAWLIQPYLDGTVDAEAASEEPKKE